MNNFIQEFETGLHIEMERVNMEEEWSGSKSANASAHLGALESFLEPVCSIQSPNPVLSQCCYSLLRDPLRSN